MTHPLTFKCLQTMPTYMSFAQLTSHMVASSVLLYSITTLRTLFYPQLFHCLSPKLSSFGPFLARVSKVTLIEAPSTPHSIAHVTVENHLILGILFINDILAEFT